MFDLHKYQRTLGDVILPDGTNVNQELLKQGWCWWYRKYAPLDAELEKLEKEAREARTGLWADPQPVPPWEWRKGKQGGEEACGPPRFHSAQFARFPLREAQDHRILGVESRRPFTGTTENREPH